MAKKKIAGRIRRCGPKPAEEEARVRALRKRLRQEFPPRDPPRLHPATEGIAAQILATREAQGLTWYAVAKRAGISNPSTVRDIEYGRDTRLSSVQAVAEVLGLRLELADA